MNDIFKKFLFGKHILVCDGAAEENTFEVLYALANMFGIRITKGRELVCRSMLLTAGECLGNKVPEPFYRNFPKSVKSLTSDQLKFDRMLHYFLTYGMDCFEDPGHSIFEEDFERTAFREYVEPKSFVCMSEADAEKALRSYVDDMLASSRPLSSESFDVLLNYVLEYDYQPEHCASKSTASRLIVKGRLIYFARFLALSDVIRVVDEMNYTYYSNTNIKKLNFKNRDRVFISKLIDFIFESGFVNIRTCFEKKADWCGILHHIHYQPKCEAAEKFCHLMRNKGNQSVYSEVERYMRERDVRRAVDALKAGKGEGAVLRNLDYLVSRCENAEDVGYVVESVGCGKPMLLLQLLMHYSNYSAGEERTFNFVSHGLMRHHTETEEEMEKRGTVLSEEYTEMMSERMRALLKKSLSGKLGRVYISPDMYKIAIPLHESAAMGGYGRLPSGSRIKLMKGEKLRAFTYWERVRDIDLSVQGMGCDGEHEEFSWRTMFREDNEMITFSGDQTSGYDGGSEYFDIDLRLFAKRRPKLRYLVFCNNVYSGTNFSDCLCRAGYMIREEMDSGEVYEPKTVKSAFDINCESTYAVLFAIDLRTRELIWLNMAIDSDAIIAGMLDNDYVLNRIGELDALSAGELVELCASELVSDPREADVAFTDEDLSDVEGVDQIHSYDFERISSLLG